MEQKIFLTSSGISSAIADRFRAYVGKPTLQEIKLAFIPTAADPEKDKTFMFDGLREIEKLGMPLTLYDIKNKTAEQLEKDLARYDVILVNGGNTFYLLDIVRKTGFGEVIRELLKEGKTYVGVSAGSIIAGPNIESAGWDPTWDTDDVGMADFTGLNLVNFAVAPHFKDSEKDLIQKKSQEVGYPILALRDGNAVLMNAEPLVIGESKYEWFNK